MDWVEELRESNARYQAIYDNDKREDMDSKREERVKVDGKRD